MGLVRGARKIPSIVTGIRRTAVKRRRPNAIVRMGTRAADITALRGLWASVLVRPVSKRVRETIGGIA